MTVDGCALTSPAQTFVDLAESLEFVDLLVLGDSLIHRTGVTVQELRSRAQLCTGRGARLAREVADCCRARCESPGESKTRLLIVAAGLPEPVCNQVVDDGAGLRSRRIDLAYPQWKLAIEYDGRHHIQRERQWSNDIRRREDLEADGWKFVVITSADLYPDASVGLQRICRAIADRSGVRPVVGNGWRRFFPE